MLVCASAHHSQLQENVKFKVYKLKSKKFRQIHISRLISHGLLSPKASAVCTACIAHAEELTDRCTSEPPLKRQKSDCQSADNKISEVITALKENALSSECLIELATALGENIKDDIFNDSKEVTKLHQDTDYLTSFNIDGYIEKRNEVLFRFILAASGGDDENEKKLLCVANAIDSVYKARNLSIISPLSFTRNLFTYSITGSRLACDINNSVSPAGSYTSVKLWLTEKSSESMLSLPDGDIITFFDNSQVLGKSWRVIYNYKTKLSVITTVLHIVPSQLTQLQKSPDLSPFQWLYSVSNLRGLMDNIKSFLDLQIDNFQEIQNVFLEARLKKVFQEQNNQCHDHIDDLIDASNTDSNISHSSIKSEDPYYIAPQSHPTIPPNVSLGEPCFVNPCSYSSIEIVFQQIQNKLLQCESSNRSWTIVGCDGLPYVLGSRIIDDNPSFQNLLLFPGLGHYEINMTRAVFKLLWDVIIEDLAKLLGFRSIRALNSCHICTDHHKSFQIIEILLFGTLDEILVPYVRGCIKTSIFPTLDGLFTYLQASNDPNYRFLSSVICNYVLALYIFRCGVRKNNQRFILAGRCKFSSLFYGLNMTIYQEIEFRDIKLRTLLPNDLSLFLQMNESFSVSGVKNRGEGGDFLLESFNRKIKRQLPPGLPSKQDWVRVCRNIAMLDEVRSCSLYC